MGGRRRVWPTGAASAGRQLCKATYDVEFQLAKSGIFSGGRDETILKL